MKTRNLILLALVVVAVGAYILLYERHRPTTEEVRERADKVFPELERDDVEWLQIHNSHGDFRVVKDGDHWRLTEPIEFPASTSTVNSLLSSLVNLREERRLDVAEVEPASYGLEEPRLRVALGTGDGDLFELAVGDETALGSNRAVQRGHDPSILLTPGWFVTDLDKQLDDWRSRDVIDVTADEVASVQVVAGPDRIQAVRDGDDWRLLEPVSDLADRDHLQSLISNLSSLRIEEFVDQEAADATALGLDEPAYRVTLVRTEGADPVELEFGDSRDQDGATQIACRRGRDTFWVNDVAATRLAKAPVRWRSTKVYGFDTWEAELFSVSAGDQQLRLERSEGLWQAPDGGEPDYTAVQQRLSELAGLEVREFDLVQPVTEPMGRIELGTKTESDGEESEPRLVSYTFYRPLAEGGDAMVTVSTRDTVMSVDPDAVSEILADPRSLIKQEQETEQGEFEG